MDAAHVIALQGLAVVLAFMAVLWLVSLPLKNASIVDIFWGPGFVLLALNTVFHAGLSQPRPRLALALVVVWGMRLGLHILYRNRGHAEDQRYTHMRSATGPSFRWKSLFTVFLLQGAILWFVGLPLVHALLAPTPATLNVLDAAGTALVLMGLFFEAVGDWQLARFKADPGHKGKVMDRGLWRYTRHPNYFGDAVVWWGFYLLGCAADGGVWLLLSPLLMTILLLKVSGVRLLEKTIADRRPGYRDYISRTSAFLPWPPRRGN